MTRAGNTQGAQPRRAALLAALLTALPAALSAALPTSALAQGDGAFDTNLTSLGTAAAAANGPAAPLCADGVDCALSALSTRCGFGMGSTFATSGPTSAAPRWAVDPLRDNPAGLMGLAGDDGLQGLDIVGVGGAAAPNPPTAPAVVCEDVN